MRIVALLLGVVLSGLTVEVLGLNLQTERPPECYEVRLAEFFKRINVESDTVYVINFWATWCKPCIEELPAFNSVARKKFDRPVKVILVSLDDTRDRVSKVQPFLKKHGYAMESVLLNETNPHKWIEQIDSTWSGAIPATLMINAKSTKRQFFEQEFTASLLETKIQNFIKD